MKTLKKQVLISEKEMTNLLMISLNGVPSTPIFKRHYVRQTRKELYSGETQSTGDRLPGTNTLTPPPPPPPPKLSRETLLNAIQESFPNQSK